jgi:ABC-type glycerol-3-phosphate transport system substrate-binding protein
MSWQACPGAIFYRRSLARKYLGTDDPAIVQTYFQDFSRFMQTAAVLYKRSAGTCVIVSSRNELILPFLHARTQSWVVNGRLVIDPAAIQTMEIIKTLFDNNYVPRNVSQWSDGWFAGMRDELRTDRREPVEVFSYFLPTWGLHYVLKPNARYTAGDWAMIQGPVAWRWGGTWLAARRDTPNAAAARELIRYLTTDADFQREYALVSGDLVTNMDAVNRISSQFSEPFLGGQNHYAMFAEIARNVSGLLEQSTDSIIEGYFQEAITAYILGEKSREQAIADFRRSVQTTLNIH